MRRLVIDGLNAFQSAAVDSVRMSQYLTALMNELRVLGVTTLYTMEVPEIIEPHIRAPISNLSVLADNLVLMRYIEQQSRLHRLISVLKVRNSDFDPRLYPFITTDHGLQIQEAFSDPEAGTINDRRKGKVPVQGQGPQRERGS